MGLPKKEDQFIQQGDLLSIVRTLRSLMSKYDDARFVINASFQHIDPDLERCMKAVRTDTSGAATSLFAFLETLEAHPLFVEQRKASIGQTEVPQ